MLKFSRSLAEYAAAYAVRVITRSARLIFDSARPYVPPYLDTPAIKFKLLGYMFPWLTVESFSQHARVAFTRRPGILLMFGDVSNLSFSFSLSLSGKYSVEQTPQRNDRRNDRLEMGEGDVSRSCSPLAVYRGRRIPGPR